MDIAAAQGGGRLPAVPPLRGIAGRAAEYIVANPGKTGEEISAAIGCPADSFRHVVPKLKAIGVTCQTWGGGGYFPPRQ